MKYDIIHVELFVTLGNRDYFKPVLSWNEVMDTRTSKSKEQGNVETMSAPIDVDK